MGTYSVYMHVNKLNGLVYIGITSRDPKKRWGHKGAGYRPKTKGSSRFYNAIRKHGWDNFEHIVLKSGLTKYEAEVEEVDLIATFNSCDRSRGYNVEHGGGSHGKLSEGQRKAISDSWQDPVKRAARISSISKGKSGKKFSDEHRRHLSEARKGRFTGSNASNARPVNQLDLDGNMIKAFGSIAEARDELGVISANICRAIRTGGTCGGFRWSYNS